MLLSKCLKLKVAVFGSTKKKKKKKDKKKNNTNIKCHTKFQQKTLKQWEACLTNKKGKVSANPLLPCL